ncbi:MAG: TonB-dependent receptor plug domain-containing protein [Saprospiraceae bacterium]|nr:TonB-dependent receptor plug domain-containing protein [Saprospiraceae bacterium]
MTALPQGIIFLILLTIVLAGCGPANAAYSSAHNAQTVRTINRVMDLMSHLQQLPGLTVSGQGQNATVVVRGAQTLNTGIEPLFVLNGQQISGSYASLYTMVSMHDVASIDVLSNPGDIGMYGARGANGVIVIRTKQ